MSVGWWHPVHIGTAHLVDVDAETVTLVRDVLADAGCLDIVTTRTTSLLNDSGAPTPELAIVSVRDGNIAPLHRVTLALRDVPVLALCDEDDIELALGAGATHCATRPLRRRELLGRIRDAMRARQAERRRMQRERKMSDAIVALQREKEDLERLACVDALTGVANRRHAMELLASEWGRAARDQLPLGLVMIDLDCFHNYNEQYGHRGGDACLQRVADAMVRALRRPSDFLGRYGGEEFMAVLPNTDPVGAKIVAERLRAAVEALGIPHAASSCARVVTCTAGFSSVKVVAGDSMERLLVDADNALLLAKTQGRNRIAGDAPLVASQRVSAQRWERYAPVYADPWFADRIPPFFEHVQNEIRALVETAREGERRSGLALARMRQKSEELGLVAVTLLVKDLEAAAREGEIGPLRRAAEELLQYVTHVQVVYRRTEQTSQCVGGMT